MTFTARKTKYLLTVVTVLLFVLAVAGQGHDTSMAGKAKTQTVGDSLIGAPTYPFSALSGIGLEDISEGSTLLWGPDDDENFLPLLDIGFNFRFDGVNYTRFGPQTNGAIALGQPWSVDTRNNFIISGLFAKLMPYWDDLCIGPEGKVHYKTIGPPGSRKLVVEWRNMEIAQGLTCNDFSANGTFQLWIFEHSGVIQFVYGNGMTQAGISGGYSVGIHVGLSANFASVNTADSSVSYTRTYDGLLAPIPAGTSYIFTPVVPAAATSGSLTDVTQTSLRLSWTDNALNERGYEIWRSTDGINYTLAGSYPANTTSANDLNLTPGTQYFYQVNAVSEGARSIDLNLSATTNPSRVINSTNTGGPWSAPSTWVGGIVPELGDDVTVVAGATVVVDTAAAAGNLTIGGAGGLAESKDISPEGGSPATVRYGETAAFTLTVANDVLIGANDSLITGGGNANQHVLYVGGDLTNNGTLDLSTNNGQAGAAIEFNRWDDVAFSGSGAVNDVFIIRVNKTAGSIVELISTNFTVAGSTTDLPSSAYLIIMSGTFKISGTFTGTHRTFPSDAYEIPPDGGLWLNNPNYTITGREGIATILGDLRISAGTYNVGLGVDQSLRLREGSVTRIEGGALNIAGMLAEYSQDTSGSNPASFNQTGGTITTCRAGSSSTQGCFVLSPQIAATISAGKVVIQNPAQSARLADFMCVCSSEEDEDVTLQFGNEFTVGAATFHISGAPNLILNTESGAHTFRALGGSWGRNVVVGTGGILDIGNVFSIRDGVLTNNGFIKGDGTNSRLAFYGTNALYTGSGSVIGALTSVDIQGPTLTVDGANKLRTRQIRLETGNIIGGSNFILGKGDSIVSNIYIGAATGDVLPGTFDAPPEFDLGTGGQGVYYQRTGASRSTGIEINPQRDLAAFEFRGAAATDTLTIAGGELKIGSLSLRQGRVIAVGGNNILHYGVTTTPWSGYVTGTVIRKFIDNTNYTFQMGLTTPTPVTVFPASQTSNPVFFSVTNAAGPLPGLLPSQSVSQNWTIAVSAPMSGTMSFRWADSEERCNEGNFKLWRQVGSGQPTIVGTDTTPNNNGIALDALTTDFNGRYGVGEQLDPGPLSVSGTVRTSGGMPIRNALVRVTGPGLGTPFIEGYTGNLGTYILEGLRVGETYTVQVGAKRYRFSPSSQAITPGGNATGIDFTANPQE